MALRRQHAAATLVQASWRCYAAATAMAQSREAVLVLQAGVRGMLQRRR